MIAAQIAAILSTRILTVSGCRSTCSPPSSHIGGHWGAMHRRLRQFLSASPSRPLKGLDRFPHALHYNPTMFPVNSIVVSNRGAKPWREYPDPGVGAVPVASEIRHERPFVATVSHTERRYTVCVHSLRLYTLVLGSRLMLLHCTSRLQ